MAKERRSTNAEQRQCASDVSPPSSAIRDHSEKAERGRIRTSDAVTRIAAFSGCCLKPLSHLS